MHLFIIIFVVNFDPKGDFVVEKVTIVQKAMRIKLEKFFSHGFQIHISTRNLW